MLKLFRTEICIALAINFALYFFGFWIIGAIFSVALLFVAADFLKAEAYLRHNSDTAHLFQRPNK